MLLRCERAVKLTKLLHRQGKLEEAAPLYKRSRAINEKVFGPDHPKVALALNNEAGLLRQMVGC